MSVIVSCPKCCDPVTLPPPPYSALMCPHCSVEFSMQPMLCSSETNLASLRREIAEEVREGITKPSPPLNLRALESIEADAAAATLPKPRQSNGVLGFLGHCVGLLGGGAVGLLAGYYLLNWFGGPHFNVWGISLPGISHTQRSRSSEDQPRDASRVATQVVDKKGSDDLSARGNEDDRGEVPPGMQMSVPVSFSSESFAAGQHQPSSQSRKEQRIESIAMAGPNLAEAIKAARNAVECPFCDSTGIIVRTVSGRSSTSQPCVVCRGRASKGITPAVYHVLCNLAKAISLLNTGDDADLLAEEQDALNIFRTATDRDEKQASIGRQAAQRIADLQSDGQGVLLVGTITDKNIKGQYHLTRLVFYGEPKTITVVSVHPIPFHPGERVAIAGSVVRNPVAELAEYRGVRGTVVLSRLLLRL